MTTDSYTAPGAIEVTSSEVVHTGPTGMPLIPPTPEVAKRAMETYQEISRALITPEDVQRIGRNEFPKRSAFQKLANAYRVSVTIIRDENDYDSEGHLIRSRITARATHPDGRVMDGDGACNRGEKGKAADDPKTEHDVHGTAVTRAKNRAIGDLIAFGAVSAEEAEGETGTPSPGGSPPPTPAWAQPIPDREVGDAAQSIVDILKAAGAPEPANGAAIVGQAVYDLCGDEFPRAVAEAFASMREVLSGGSEEVTPTPASPEGETA